MMTIMNLILICFISLGVFSYVSSNQDKYMKIGKNINIFMDLFRHIAGYLIAFAIGYYFVGIKLPLFRSGEVNFSISELILFIIFIISILGWLPYYIKKIHEEVGKLLKQK